MPPNIATAWRVSSDHFLISCPVGEPLAFDAKQSDFGALFIIDPKLGAVVLAEIKFGQIAIKVLLIDVLVNADQATFENREEAFEGVHMHVAARPLEFRVIDAFVLGDGRKLVVLCLIGNEASVRVNVATDMAHDAAMIEDHGTDHATTLDKAQDVSVRPLALGSTLGLARIGERGFICFDGLTGAAQGTNIAAGSHGEADAMAKVPSGFHSAAQGPLKLTARNAFLARAKQMDRLQPETKRKMAILENGADLDGEGLAAAVALAEARTGGLAIQAANLVANRPAMRADGTVGPEPGFDVLEGGSLGMEVIGGKDRIGHLLAPMARTLGFGGGYVK